MDPDVRCAQVNTGASATVTDQLDLVHGHREFGPDFPCPIRLLPAKEGSDTIPKGAGFLHVRSTIHNYVQWL